MKTLTFNNVYLKDATSVVGPLEKQGPLSDYFNKKYDDDYLGEKNWDDAEKKMLDKTIQLILQNNELIQEEIDMFVAGELTNQNGVSNFVLGQYKTQTLGTYSACATIVESMIISSLYLDKIDKSNVIACTSSHNKTAERQFRYPNEYGGKKPDTATTTITGASSFLLTNTPTKIKITNATIGKVIDTEVKNANDMGSAMAPAAYDTIKTHLSNLNIDPDYYDLILTGDLSAIGSMILKQLFQKDNIDMINHKDAGLMIYDLKKQEVFAGGSGPACIGVVSASYILTNLRVKNLNKVLLCATGALLNPISVQQKLNIPSICHCISLERCD